jgi:hypothetical protein
MIIEDVEDQEEARGRSGKGLLAQFVEWIRWTVQQDGRNYKGDSQFKMQQLVPGVQVYYLNDPAPGVLMNQFYNYITDDWLVEAKGKKAYSIPYKNSPKILITTNYLPNIESDSDKDRFIVLAIKKVFGSTYAVRDAFPGVIFFDDQWRREDALGAVRFAIDCIQLYLRHGVMVYKNDAMVKNANKRMIATIVPDSIREPIEQALDVARSARNAAEFEMGLKVYDMRKDMPESISKAFGWEPGKLIIYLSRLYQYCLAGPKMKNINDRYFGRKVRFYIEKSGLQKAEEVRNNSHGIRIAVHYDGAMTENKSAVTEKKGAVQTKNDGLDFTEGKFTPLDMDDF